MNSRWHPEISEKKPCYWPYGKVDGTASPSLSRTCGKLLQLHLWRLGSAAPSTFTTLGSTLRVSFQVVWKHVILQTFQVS